MTDPAPDIFATKRETVEVTAPDAAERLRALFAEHNRSYADIRGNLHARRQAAANALRALGFDHPEDVPAASKQLGGPGVTLQVADIYTAWLYCGALLAQAEALGAALTPEVNNALVLALSVGEDCFRAFARKVEADAARGKKNKRVNDNRNTARWGTPEQRDRSNRELFAQYQKIRLRTASKEAAYRKLERELRGKSESIKAGTIKAKILAYERALKNQK